MKYLHLLWRNLTRKKLRTALTAFGVFWMRMHIASAVHDEVLQAAKVDGTTAATPLNLMREELTPALQLLRGDVAGSLGSP